MKGSFSIIFFAVVLLVSGLEAGEGTMPIAAVTTITAPGSYVVTRDIASPGFFAVRIAANNVVLDLGGHTLSAGLGCALAAGVVVVDVAAGPVNVTIRNGHLVGGCHGIARLAAPNLRARIENVEVERSTREGIFLTPVQMADIRGCHIHDLGTALDGAGILLDGAPFTGRILDNEIARVTADGMFLNGLYDGQVRGNVVTDFGSGGGAAGIKLLPGGAGPNSGGNLVEGNTITNFPSGGAPNDDGMLIGTPNNYVVGNVVRRNGGHGIWSVADGTRIERNVVSGNINHGIRIGNGVIGTWNHLDRNQSQGSGVGCGVQFDNAGNHAYGNNNFRNNFGGAKCGAWAAALDLLHNAI